MNRNASGAFVASDKRRCSIEQNGTHHYVLHGVEGHESMGGDNKQALVKFARSLGYMVGECVR